MTKSSDRPIGIFDSGIGGLTVARAIKAKMPKEQIIYFGDTAHLPYGDKSTAAIQAYSIKIVDLLLAQGCKVIVIACNSASAASYELLHEYVASKSAILNVIDPMVAHIGIMHQNETIGIIGTQRTIESDIYPRKISELNRNIKVKSVATPLLVPMIEEGFVHNKIAQDVISEYMNRAELKGINSLVLGCTHYPLIKEEIEQHVKLKCIDSSIITAKYVQDFLSEKNLLSNSEQRGDQFFVSDLTSSFEHATAMFFGKEVNLQKHKLWE